MRPVGDSWLESVINAFYVGSMKYSLYARIIHVSLPKPAGHIHLTVCLDLQGKLYDRVTSHADPIDVLTLPRWAAFPIAFFCVWKTCARASVVTIWWKWKHWVARLVCVSLHCISFCHTFLHTSAEALKSDRSILYTILSDGFSLGEQIFISGLDN